MEKYLKVDTDVSLLRDTDTNAIIGGDSLPASGSQYYFNGMLSNLQVWNAAWSVSDALFAYQNPEQLALNNSGTSLAESNLKVWYPMNDGHR